MKPGNFFKHGFVVKNVRSEKKKKKKPVLGEKKVISVRALRVVLYGEKLRKNKRKGAW